MQKIKITAVKYYNTLPMVYGLQHCEVAKNSYLELATPSECAYKLQMGEADISLIPVAAIYDIENANIFSNYCIGAIGPVRTVVLVSNVPFNEIDRVLLDPHSRTSIALIKILANEYWKKTFQFVPAQNGFEHNAILGTTAGLVIGDKVFDIENKYPYIYDLAEVWTKLTGLPFVFAVWVSRIALTENFIKLFEEAMQFGIENIDTICNSEKWNARMDAADLAGYLKNNINFKFDEPKKQAMQLFIEKMTKLKLTL